MHNIIDPVPRGITHARLWTSALATKYYTHQSTTHARRHAAQHSTMINLNATCVSLSVSRGLCVYVYYVVSRFSALHTYAIGIWSACRAYRAGQRTIFVHLYTMY